MSANDGGSSDRTSILPTSSTRAPHSKSRRGCQTCKKRHIRCDERIPECTNCSRRGLKCPGYRSSLRWSTKYELLRGRGGLQHPHAHGSVLENVNQFIPSEQGLLHPLHGMFAAPEMLGFSGALYCPGDDSASSSTELQADDGVRAHGDISMGALATVARPGSTIPASFATADMSHTFLDPDGNNIGYVTTIGANTDISEQHLAVPQSLTHLPTHLIECWFAHVCPIWSTFDSNCNNNRHIASVSWSSSAAVFHTLQHMSAAYMVHSRPELKDMLPAITVQAAHCIKKELSLLKTSSNPVVTIDLVFAVLALGTSLHWTNDALDVCWLEDIRMLLNIWRKNMSPSQDLIHAYFRQATSYWQMLMCLVRDDIVHEGLGRRRRKQENLLMAVISSNEADLVAHPLSSPDIPPTPGGTTLPNSWCGASFEAIDLFGQVLALCRRARSRETRCKFTLRSSREAICDIQIAKELREELIALDVQMTMVVDELYGFTVDTRDAATPMAHLLLTADAYRKASLLQLYLTFDDLEVRSAGDSSFETINICSASGSSFSRTRKLSELALQIITTLQEIPLDSRVRSIHPILYLAVAPGLKLSTAEHESTDPYSMRGPSQTTFMMDSETSPLLDEPLDYDTLSATTTQGYAIDGEHLDHSSSFLSTFSSRIEHARSFVEERVNALRHVLPERPLTMVLELIHAIWNHNVISKSKAKDIHWMDIMMNSTLQTLFR